MDIIKRHMQFSILNTDVNNENYLKNLSGYQRLFGYDDFLMENQSRYLSILPKVLVVNISASESESEIFLREQFYQNVKVINLQDKNANLYEMKNDFTYMCFIENGYVYSRTKLIEMVLDIIQSEDAMVFGYRNFITADNSELKDVSFDYYKKISGYSIKGCDVIPVFLQNDINIWGGMSTMLLDIKKVDDTSADLNNMTDSIGRLDCMFSLLQKNSFHFYNSVVAKKTLGKYDYVFEKQIGDKYFLWKRKYLSSKFNINNVSLQMDRKYTNTKNEITFFYTDKGEYYNLLPIQIEAEKRGYKTRFTMELEEKAEIGIYCQHLCYPENSKLSVILLHDLAQRHDIWPNIWRDEHWNDFDIGILPGEEWSRRYSECCCLPYANPRIGTYVLGYPKADVKISDEEKNRLAELKINLKYEKTVLYAPSWENDEKEDEFVTYLHDLPVNLIIKQADWPDEYEIINDNIRKMRALHEGKFENLTYLEQEENIIVALMLCDVVVSDESSVMTEAILFDKPSVAVTDWRIPDQNPSRFACVPYDYVKKTKKKYLKDAVLELIESEDERKKYLDKGRNVFSNKGFCSRNIMDLIDSIIIGGKDENVKGKQAYPYYEKIGMWV